MLDTKIVLFLVVASFTFQPICFVYSAPYFTGILNAGKDAGGTLELGRAGKTIAGAADASGTGGRLSSGGRDAGSFVDSQRAVGKTSSEAADQPNLAQLLDERRAGDAARQAQALENLKAPSVAHPPANAPFLAKLRTAMMARITKSAKVLKSSWNDFLEIFYKALKSLSKNPSVEKSAPAAKATKEVDSAALLKNVENGDSNQNLIPKADSVVGGDEEIDPEKLLADLIKANPDAKVTDPADTPLGQSPSESYKAYKAGRNLKSKLNTIFSGKDFKPST